MPGNTTRILELLQLIARHNQSQEHRKAVFLARQQPVHRLDLQHANDRTMNMQYIQNDKY
jgi:hypothetical protein